MQETVKPLDPNRLSVLVAMLLLGSVLFRFIELPEQVWKLRPLGSPLEIRITGTWLLTTLIEHVRQRSQRLGKSAQVELPDGRWLVAWETHRPRLYENYIIQWEW